MFEEINIPSLGQAHQCACPRKPVELALCSDRWGLAGLPAGKLRLPPHMAEVAPLFYGIIPASGGCSQENVGILR